MIQPLFGVREKKAKEICFMNDLVQIVMMWFVGTPAKLQGYVKTIHAIIVSREQCI